MSRGLMPAFPDAHRHPTANSRGDTWAVLNGSSPLDWPDVLDAALDNPRLIPAIGLHPWRVRDAPPDWQDNFLQTFGKGARAIGEIGLDALKAKDTLPAQVEAFSWQFAQAARRNLPVSIHCLKATPLLLKLLRENRRPPRGFHLHAYNGSAEEVSLFAELGAYFSFHLGQLTPPARKTPAALRAVPLERLLIESDAAGCLLGEPAPSEYLQATYQAVAKMRSISLETLVDQVTLNFRTFFIDV